MYWYSVPSQFKHCFDQVLSRGWAYEVGGTALRGKHRLWVLISSPWYNGATRVFQPFSFWGVATDVIQFNFKGLAMHLRQHLLVLETNPTGLLGRQDDEVGVLLDAAKKVAAAVENLTK